MWARFALFAAFLCGVLLAMGLQPRPTPADIGLGPDIVSGASPPLRKAPKIYTMRPPEALRMAAEVVALSVLRGGPQYLRRSEYAGGGLDSNSAESWQPADREYGFGTPLMQWHWDGERQTADNARRALAALLARRIAEATFNGSAAWDPITEAEVLPVWCEARVRVSPGRDFLRCLKDGLKESDPVFSQAMTCASAIVQRNATVIRELAARYGRTVSPSQYDEYDVLTYSGTNPREQIPVCNGYHCGAGVHGALFEEQPLDTLATRRRGLPAFCAADPPVRYKSALRGRRSTVEAPAERQSAGDVFARMAAAKVVASYLLVWDIRPLSQYPDSHIGSEQLPMMAFHGADVPIPDGGRVPPPDGVDMRVLFDRSQLIDYAALRLVGEQALGRRGTSGVSRFVTDRAFCRQSLTEYLGEDREMQATGGRLEHLWQSRCAAWASSVPNALPPAIRRAVAERLRTFERCADALNRANAKPIAALSDVFLERIKESVMLAGKNAQNYGLQIVAREVLEVLEANPPVVPRACNAFK